MADEQAEDAERMLREATLEFEAAQAAGDQPRIDATKRAMGEAFGNLVVSKRKPQPASQPGLGEDMASPVRPD